MKVKFLVFLGLIGLVWGCGQSKSGFDEEMYEHSELAKTMRSMLEQYGEAKENLEDGKLVFKPVDYYGKILTAEPTDSNDINDLYKSLGQTFIDQAKRYENAGDTLSLQIKQHNLTIHSCISCHEHFCGGPITAIEKLIIKEEP